MDKPAFTPRVFSGIKPSGGLTLGNYLGAIKRFVDMQGGEFETIYCVMDMHDTRKLHVICHYMLNKCRIVVSFTFTGHV